MRGIIHNEQIKTLSGENSYGIADRIDKEDPQPVISQHMSAQFNIVAPGR